MGGDGLGLEPGVIERNSNGTATYIGDDTFFLSMNGVSSRIVQEPTGAYHLSDENFWKIEKLASPNSWVVSDKTGNVYYFEKVTRMRYLNGGTCTLDGLDIRWGLTRIKNVFGKVLTYGYGDETKSMNNPEWKPSEICGTGATYDDVTTASYLSSIQYPGNTYRIEFGLEARPDYKASYASDPIYHDFQRQRLDSISIKYYDTASASYKTIRQYFLDYFTSAETGQVIFPGITWNSAGKTSTLKALRSGAVQNGVYKNLQTYTFSYVDGNTPDNNLHLKSVDNGLGGVVKYTYERWNIATGGANPGYASEYHTVAHNFGKAGNPCGGAAHSPAPYGLLAGTSGFVTCADNGGAPDEMIIGGIATSGKMAENLIVPGGLYRIWASASGINGSSVVLGWRDGSTNAFLAGLTGTFELPPDASSVELLIKESGTGEGHVYRTKFELLSSGYRVKTKTASHAATNSTDTRVYTYTYSGAAVNTHANTDASLLCTDTDPFNPPAEPDCYEYVPEYSEFRGHQQVSVVGPEGLKTVSTYLQDYIHKGQPETITVQKPKTGGWETVSQKLFEYAETVYTNILKPSREGCHVGTCQFSGLYRNWGYLVSQEQRSYNSGGSYAASLSSFTYGPYGNQTVKSDYSWNGTGWELYRKFNTNYYPNSTGVNLVGLPARRLSTNAAGAWLQESLYLYDGASNYTDAPTAGKMTATRGLVSILAGVKNYSQELYAYDGWGNRTKVTTNTGFYDSLGNVLSAGVSQTTSTSYDASYHTYPVSIKNGLNQTTNLIYDLAFGVPLSETDANGAVTTAQYDAWGRLTALIRPGDSASLPSAQVFYDDSAPVSTTAKQLIDGSRYLAVRRTYDGFGRQYLQESGAILGAAGQTFTTASKLETIYEDPNKTLQSAPFPPGGIRAFTTTTFDPAGQSLTVTAPDGSTSQSVENGLTTTLTDARGGVTSTTRDVWGRVVWVQPPAGPGVSYEYNPSDLLTTTTRASNATTLSYNYAGQKTKMIDPDLGTWYYSYDALSNLLTQTDARGCVLSLGYDTLNRLTGKSSNNGAGCGAQVSVTYGYDAGTNGKGRRTSMADASVGATWTYDARGRLISETKTILGSAYSTQWGYNSADLPVSMTYPGGEVVTTAYNDLMQPITLSGANSYVTSGAYDAAGRLTSRTLGNGLRQIFTYHPRTAQGGRLASITINGGPQNLAYTYDAGGNITQIVDGVAGETQAYTYDSLERLTGWSLNGVSQEDYTYNNDTGNLVGKGSETLRYDDANHDHAVTQMGTNTYGYDANGNQITRNIGSDTYTLAYDAENRLVDVQKNGAALAAFVYDGDGRRVKSTINGVETVFAGNYYEVTGGAVTKYYFFGGAKVAMRDNGTLYYPLTDHLGSTTVTTDASGNVNSELRYKPFGETRLVNGTTLTEYQFTGQYSNVPDFGLYFYNARWYDPGISEFVQPDTLIPEPYNNLDYQRYSYGRYNPQKYVDPDGHNPIVVFFLAAAKVVTTAIDWGWTAYDVYNSASVALDANNAPEVRTEAIASAAAAIGAELLEPDEGLPISLPLDDIARHGNDVVDGAEAMASQIHHFASDKHLTKWTEQFSEITSKYGLDLNEAWNKLSIPGHSGRHPDEYHQWVLEQMEGINKQLGNCGPNCAEKFIEMFKKQVINPVLENPSMLKKHFWE